MTLQKRWNQLRPELRTRIQTAVVGGAAFLGVTMGLGTWGTALVGAILSLLMTQEYLGMVLELPDRNEKRQVLLGTVWLVAFFSFIIPRSEYELLLAAFLGLFFYFLLTAWRHASESTSMERHLRELVYCLFGLVYLGFLPLFLPLIRGQEDGALWLLEFFFLNWVGDSAAYFVGMKKGRNKLYTDISPKKTWEGAWGGLAGGFVVTLLFKLVAFQSMSWGFVIVGPVLVGVSAQLGDLCESFVKRSFGKKDSGSLLPGHGGLLDRFDGLVISAPVMYLCIRTFG